MGNINCNNCSNERSSQHSSQHLNNHCVSSAFISVIVLMLFSASFEVFSAEAKSEEVSTVAKKSNKNLPTQTLVIQSQVKGSQEQPNVIYIMPWQGIDKVIEVKGKKRTISLPHFKPINPRDFKEQVRSFASKPIAPSSTEN